MFATELLLIVLAPLYGVYRTWSWLNTNISKLLVQSRVVDDLVEGKLHWSAAGIASALVGLMLAVITVPTLFHMFPLLLPVAGLMYAAWIGMGIMWLYRRYASKSLAKSLKDL